MILQADNGWYYVERVQAGFEAFDFAGDNRFGELGFFVAVGYVAADGLLQIVDVVSDRRLSVAEAAARETGIGSALAVPLISAQGIVGVLSLYGMENDAFTTDDLAALTSVSATLASALERIPADGVR